MNGYRLNHTALSVHRIAQHSGNVAEFAAELQARGFVMNEEGGLIKARGGWGRLTGILLSFLLGLGVVRH